MREGETAGEGREVELSGFVGHANIFYSYYVQYLCGKNDICGLWCLGEKKNPISPCWCVSGIEDEDEGEVVDGVGFLKRAWCEDFAHGLQYNRISLSVTVVR